MATKIPQAYLSRQAEITQLFQQVMNAHMDDFMAGRAPEMVHIRELASRMCLHPVHVSSVIKLHTGFHPCYFYELRIVEEARNLLADFSLAVGEVASRLTYDTSNFTKFFKTYAGLTPTEYRKKLSGAPALVAAGAAPELPQPLRLVA
ncbi:helix-turn-helix domain-containing protein [Hymenobacter negativus]|uniref:AraC family transcriptional regulator n=1 Tax=Hymenobacter negativus TaxID=2795026 RepID=A0ABS3QJS3_9BACT|nr:AraC family transcriptional regulator [Hymenobacter negativus]MBO2011503.1 AraC family transcriptional regulator [Hymenobacter negativus]